MYYLLIGSGDGVIPIECPDDIDEKIVNKFIYKRLLYETLGKATINWNRTKHCYKWTAYVTPNMMIDRGDDGKLIPDLNNLPSVDKKTLLIMIKYWRAENRNSWNDLLNEIEENIDYLYNCLDVHDIIT